MNYLFLRKYGKALSSLGQYELKMCSNTDNVLFKSSDWEFIAQTDHSVHIPNRGLLWHLGCIDKSEFNDGVFDRLLQEWLDIHPYINDELISAYPSGIKSILLLNNPKRLAQYNKFLCDSDGRLSEYFIQEAIPIFNEFNKISPKELSAMSILCDEHEPQARVDTIGAKGLKSVKAHSNEMSSFDRIFNTNLGEKHDLKNVVNIQTLLSVADKFNEPDIAVRRICHDMSGHAFVLLNLDKVKNDNFAIDSEVEDIHHNGVDFLKEHQQLKRSHYVILNRKQFDNYFGKNHPLKENYIVVNRRHYYVLYSSATVISIREALRGKDVHTYVVKYLANTDDGVEVEEREYPYAKERYIDVFKKIDRGDVEVIKEYNVKVEKQRRLSIQRKKQSKIASLFKQM